MSATLPGQRPALAFPIGRALFARRNALVTAGAAILLLFVLAAIFAPLIAGDPTLKVPSRRLLPPGREFWFGTDHLGQDVFARTVYGTRVSLAVGCSVAALSVGAGLVLGLIAGYFRAMEAPVMRFMDGLMAIPSIMLAIALVSLNQGGITTVIAAIAIPELPRVVRLVRSVVLSVRALPFVEATVSCGAKAPRILLVHILPNTIAPIIVQATYISASAILIEASLSFLGAGISPDIPTWGNMIATSRLYLARAPWALFCPAASLALVIVAVNLLGDGLRDKLDPRLRRRL